MAALDQKDGERFGSLVSGSSWRNIGAFIAVLVGLLAALWIAMNAAGTAWSIPVAVVIVIVVGVVLLRAGHEK